MFPTQDEILAAFAPLGKQMEALNSNGMKVTLRDANDNPLVTLVVAREDKAAVVDKAIDLVDAAYDAGRDGGSMDTLNTTAGELVTLAYEAGRVAEMASAVEMVDGDEPESDDEPDWLDDDDFDDDWDDDDWEDDFDFVDDDEVDEN